MQSLKVGEANVSIINVGDFNFTLKDISNAPENQWGEYSDIYRKPTRFPSQTILVSLPSLSLIVDPGNYSRFAAIGKEYVINDRDYTPPPSLLEQLSQIGVSRENINYVVITHGHYDHYAGSTFKSNENEIVPTFPRALHFLGKQDFESQQMQEGLRKVNSETNETVGVLLRRGLLELVEAGRQISDEVEIIPAPGESPGHKIVRISSNEETLYCVGDLFHHSSEVENPTWMARWNDYETSVQSRTELTKSALAENALITAAHMPLGRVERRNEKVVFVVV